MKKIEKALVCALSVAAFDLFCNLALAQEARVRVPSGTVVAVRLKQVVDPKAQVLGSQVTAVVATDVQIDEITVIKAGAPVIANVEEVEKAASIGKGAKITVILRSVQAIDGTNIPLSGTYRAVGEDKEGSTIALGVILCPLFLLREGDDTQLAAGAETRAMTLGDSTVRVSAAKI